MNRIAMGILATALAAVAPQESFALIMGGEGNAPVRDPGWPAGAAAIFNHPGRIAWWEGPPFGGGQWHAECRGDARALGAVLENFAKLDVEARRVVLHDGTGQSFWLAPNREPGKRAAARIDWAFTVWVPASWERLRRLPADLNPTDPSDDGPPAQIDVYTGHLRWADVTVPKGVEVIDRRLVAHGFSADDGVVLEGKVTDLETGNPVAAAVRLERVEPQQKGGYRYPAAAGARADAQGRWVLKHAPAGWFRVAVEADGFVPRVAGYARFDGEPCWQSFDCALARPAPVSGRVTDDGGRPLEGVAVTLGDVAPGSGGRYESTAEYAARTDDRGRFRVALVPAGKATVWVRKPGYVRPGLGPAVMAPSDDVALTMVRSAGVRVAVDFTGKERPGGYIVQMEPEGGNVVGSYGGSGSIDTAHRITFNDVPPGRYVLRGQPNPSSADQRTEPVTVDLKGGQTAEVTLKAK